MNVKLLFFGELKDRVGKDHMDLILPEAVSVDSLLAKALGDEADHQVWQKSIMYAVNEEQVSASTQIQDGDEVAFLPPMSGG